MWGWARGSWPADLDGVDFYFFVLRLLTILGGYAWSLVAPLTPESRIYFPWLLAGFALYSGLLYTGIFRWPRKARSFYLSALGIDLAFVITAIHYIGQLRGSIYTVLYLLVAIPAFYFGLMVGLVASAAAAVLYVGLYLFGGGVEIFPPSDLFLRLVFLFLIAGSLGLLAERERRYRAKIVGLNRELSHRNFVLEQFYRYFSGRLASGVAERVNNPLGIIALQAENLIRDAKERQLPSPFISGLEVIARQAYQASSVTKALMFLAHRDDLEMIPVDLNEVLESTLHLIKARSDMQGITIDREIATGLPTILGNAEGLQEAFLHIFNSAEDALPDGGTMRVMASPRDGTVECIISHNGMGIPRDQIEDIFDPFSPSKTGMDGIDMDLIRTLGIIRGHLGIVGVESEVGVGTTFTIAFPVAPTGSER